MARILLVNAWEEFDEAIEYIQNGGDQYALDHFYGYDAIKNTGHQVSCLKYNRRSLLNRIGQYFKLENLQQQIDCVKRQDEYDLIYDPFMTHTLLLAVLKKFGLFEKPIFGFAQRAHVVRNDNLIKGVRDYIVRYFYFKGVDYIWFINKGMYEESKKHPISIAGKSDYARHWGVDLDFFESYREAQTAPPTADFILSTGGTARDFKTLIQAFKGVNLNLKIIPKKNMKYPKRCEVLPNVVIDNSLPIGLLSTGALRKEYYNALAIAIPVKKTRWYGPYGSTVLFEALSMGKPVITTDNEAYPINVEKEKVGLNVDYGDVKGWRQAINYLLDHPEEAREMGERGVRLCKERFNYELFSNELVEHFSKIVESKRSGYDEKSTVSKDVVH